MKRIRLKIIYIVALLAISETAICGCDKTMVASALGQDSIGNGNYYYCYKGDTLHPLPEIVGGDPPTVYSGPFYWWKDDSLLGNFSEMLITQSGEYQAVYEDYSGCGEMAAIFNVVFYDVTAVKEIPLEENFKIYPNPFSNNFHLVANLGQPAPTTLTICDMMGREIFLTDFSSSNGLDKQIDLSSIPDGMYIAVLSIGNIREKKIIVKGFM